MSLPPDYGSLTGLGISNRVMSPTQGYELPKGLCVFRRVMDLLRRQGLPQNYEYSTGLCVFYRVMSLPQGYESSTGLLVSYSVICLLQSYESSTGLFVSYKVMSLQKGYGSPNETGPQSLSQGYGSLTEKWASHKPKWVSGRIMGLPQF